MNKEILQNNTLKEALNTIRDKAPNPEKENKTLVEIQNPLEHTLRTPMSIYTGNHNNKTKVSIRYTGIQTNWSPVRTGKYYSDHKVFAQACASPTEQSRFVRTKVILSKANSNNFPNQSNHKVKSFSGRFFLKVTF